MEYKLEANVNYTKQSWNMRSQHDIRMSHVFNFFHEQ